MCGVVSGCGVTGVGPGTLFLFLKSSTPTLFCLWAMYVD